MSHQETVEVPTCSRTAGPEKPVIMILQRKTIYLTTTKKQIAGELVHSEPICAREIWLWLYTQIALSFISKLTYTNIQIYVYVCILKCLYILSTIL